MNVWLTGGMERRQDGWVAGSMGELGCFRRVNGSIKALMTGYMNDWMANCSNG